MTPEEYEAQMMEKYSENDPVDDLFDYSVRSPVILVQVEFHDMEHITDTYKFSTVRGISGYPIEVYVDGNKNYKADIVYLVCGVGKATCMCECVGTSMRIVFEMLNRDRIQIPPICIKKITRLRFDDFDFGEGYSNLIPFNELDGNEQAAIDMENERNGSSQS